ncbi:MULTISPECIES: LysR family transcriptional regulator [unclassified Halomonas]|uniref:LysR family transcriptional regulator n=1 Tax=unclassified Halomonas TaxID=2609666 RepID=UPI0021E38FF9|nr:MULTISPECIES: LysR family transcriptional regulator [unclassified Halomonas]UYG01365.1 LysR family transcriptional regulator [Halomonas sp. GD1P12]WNL37578.1 LysR family transcriptional regulator [Halomonas sp. PAMB 3232]WNL40892.1 LysR family transcriptional regulator [Halomonas sp. PAMB 3264]
MDTQSLQAFIAVADTQSFSRAAEQLHLTQPAISKRIATLETQVGARLFDRIGRRISLTEAGRLLRPRALHIMQSVEDSRRALANLSGQVGGTLTLGTSHHIGLHRLPPILKRYTERHPNVALDLRFQDSELAYQGVIDGTLEIAVVTLAPTPSEQLETAELWRDRLCFVCAPDHPLARKQTPLTLDRLSTFTCVMPGLKTFTHSLIEKRFLGVGLTLSVGMATNYLETLKMMCSVGLGWSVLPEKMLDDTLVELNVETPPIERPLGYLVHTDRTLSNAARQMIEALTASY